MWNDMKRWFRGLALKHSSAIKEQIQRLTHNPLDFFVCPSARKMYRMDTETGYHWGVSDN